MTSNTVMPSWEELSEAMHNPEFSDASKNTSVSDEEGALPPDDLPPIPIIFKGSVSAAKWADMSVVARAMHINIAARSMRRVQQQEAKKSLVRQQEMEDKEAHANIAAAAIAAARATQQASTAVHHRDELLRQYDIAERAASESARAADACIAELAAEERRAAALLVKRRRTERRGPPIPRQPPVSPHLRSPSRSASPPPPELDQAPSSGGAVSTHTPEGGAYVYEDDRQEGDSAFLGVLLSEFACHRQVLFLVNDACAVEAAAAALAYVTEDNPFTTLNDVLDHAVADPDFPAISAGGHRLLMALRSAHRHAISEVTWPRLPSVTTTLVGEGGQVHDAVEGIRPSAPSARDQDFSSRRGSGLTGGFFRQADRRDGGRTGCSPRHADRRDGRKRQSSRGKGQRNSRGRGRNRGGRQPGKISSAGNTDYTT